MTYEPGERPNFGKAVVVGELAVKDGCVVLKAGDGFLVPAFIAENVTWDGTKLSLRDRRTDKVSTYLLGDLISVGGAYLEFASAASDPTVTIPDACSKLAPDEYARVG